MANIEELTTTVIGVKTEVLDIKETLADYDEKLKKVDNDIQQNQIDFKKQINSKLEPYIKSETVKNDYYNKNEIDSKLSNIESLGFNDVENYLSRKGYITLATITNYAKKSDVNTLVESNLQNYITTDDANKLFVLKTDLEDTDDNEIDLSKYVELNYLKDRYYDKDEVKALIPSLSGYVKTSELYSLLPLNTYAEKTWATNTFVKKSDLSFDGYVTEIGLDNKLKEEIDFVKSNYYTKVEVESLIPSLNGYVLKSDLLSLINLDNYALNTWVDKNFVKKTDLSFDGYVTKEDLENTIKDEIDLSKYVELDYLKEKYYTKSEVEQMIPSVSGFVKKSELLSLLPFDNYAQTDWVKQNYMRKGEISLDGYVTENMLNDVLSQYSDVVSSKDFKLTLSGYVREEELNSELSDLSKLITQTYIPNLLEDYMLKDTFVKTLKNYLTKEEFRNYVVEHNSSASTGGSDIDLSKYVKISELNSKMDVLIDNIYGYIPKSFNNLVNDKNLIDKSYVDGRFATKEDLRNIIGSESNNSTTSNDIDLAIYAKRSDLSRYMLISDMFNYVNYTSYNNKINLINTSLSTINDTLKKTVTKTQLGDYVRFDNFVSELNKYVTKENLEEEISKINSNGGNNEIDTDGFLTIKDYDRFKGYVTSVLADYPTSKDVYSRNYIDKNYIKSVEISDKYYTKKESDSNFLNKKDAGNTYLTISEAHSDFLAKEDYRGIKDAMVLNSAYKNSVEIFDELLERAKLNDGFYIVEDRVKIVKDGKVYDTLLTGSDAITKNEVLAMNFVTKEEFDQNKGKNWIYDEGGNY